MSNFIHLHVHTNYSILDGQSNIKKLISRAKELEMPALAITDHGNMFGAKLFHSEATKAGIKPILGCEAYVANRTRFDKSDKSDKSGFHLILLAKNIEGYHNLIKMASYAYTEGLYYRPRIDWQLLEQYHEGIICCSACIGGHIPKAIIKGDMEGAEKLVRRFKSIFNDDFYLELQLHEAIDNPENRLKVYEKQLIINRHLLELGEKYDVKCIASNDVHFVKKDDAEAHEHLLCISTGTTLYDETRMRYSRQEYLKSYDEMLELFSEHPELLSNTLEVAEKVEQYSLSHSAFMPDFPLPENFILDIKDYGETFLNAMQNTISSLKDKDRKAILLEEFTKVTTEVNGAANRKELEDLANNNSWSSEFRSEDLIMIARQFIYLRHVTYEGATKRYGESLNDVQSERIAFELATIERMGFPGYFLIVWDFIREARDMGVSVGPGRGSAAGSVVAYCLGITNIDPIKYDLLFERFLNPERISMPDIDIDFDEDGREQVMKYVVKKYGQKRVAHIITFGTMAAKMAIRDVARVQNLPLQESIRLTKLVPDKPGTTLAKAYKEVEELNKERESENKVIRDTLKVAEDLEGAVRQTGIHACGIIIGKDDLENFIPVSTNKDTELFVVQYDGKHVEDVGLLKMDFLGLKTLSIIKDAVDNIKLSKGIDLDIDKIPLDDKLTFDLYSRGDTTGLFQFESPGMKKYLRDLQPNRFEDLIAMNALYRPGPIEYIPKFIARKHGKEPITYDLDDMDEYLKDTYGITVYQEQVMLLSQKLAGFTKGQADTLRKAMGKKMIDVLNKMKGDFIKGATERGHDASVCEKVWKDWEAFASYAFNKSHSTCYAYVSYQTAYLKAHYPSEFMAGLLSRNMSDIKKVSLFMEECKRMGAPVKGPDVNHSQRRFAVDSNGNIRFGLAAIKGVGEAAVENIIEERNKRGAFKDIYDFVERINLQSVNKKTIENLAFSGALDSLISDNRECFCSNSNKVCIFLEAIVRYGNVFQNELHSAQSSLFGDMIGDVSIQRPPMEVTAECSQLELLNREKELIGIYISAHPLDKYKVLIDKFCSPIEDLKNTADKKGQAFKVAGMVTNATSLLTKTGNPYGRITVEDFSGSYEFSLFGKDYESLRNYCYDQYQILISGHIVQRWEGADYIPKIDSITMLCDASQQLIKDLSIVIPCNIVTKTFTADLKENLEKSLGKTKLNIKIYDPETNIILSMVSKGYRVNITTELINYLSENGIYYNIN